MWPLLFDLRQEAQSRVGHAVSVRTLNIGVLFSHSTVCRTFAALALAALAILAFRPVCDAYAFASQQAEAGQLCCSALDANTPVPPAKSAIPAGGDRGAPNLGILAALIPLAVARRHQWLPAGAFLPLALGSYHRRSARLLR